MNEPLSIVDKSQRYILQLFSGDARILSLHLELMDAGSLQDLYQDGYWSVDRRTLRLVLENISSALAYCHDLGIIHNDVKPSNIFLDSATGPKLADFGSATRGPSTNAGGTRNFICPEFQVSGARGAPADMWAFGLTMLFITNTLQRFEHYRWFDFHKARGQDKEATNDLYLWHQYIDQTRQANLFPLEPLGDWMIIVLAWMTDFDLTERAMAQMLAETVQKTHLGELPKPANPESPSHVSADTVRRAASDMTLVPQAGSSLRLVDGSNRVPCFAAEHTQSDGSVCYRKWVPGDTGAYSYLAISRASHTQRHVQSRRRLPLSLAVM